MKYPYLTQHTSHDKVPTRRARFPIGLAALLALAALVLFAPPRADAITDAEELTRFGSFGSGAGQLHVYAQSIAADPTTGHVFVVDAGRRINEFTPWGDFVKAFGWDVAPGAVNEQQEVRVRAATGQFRLSFGASSTPDLASNAPGSEDEGPGSIEAALNALPSIGGAGGEVSVKAAPGTADGVIPSVHVITFKGSLAATDVAQITAANGTTPLSGGDPSTVLEARTRADGTNGGTGLESCTAESGCKAGIDGSGAGQLGGEGPKIALDAAGNVYVTEIRENHRVQKFDSAGRFLLMFGGEVNETTNEDRCTATSGDACGIGAPGTGPGEFGPNNSAGIAFGPTGKLFVADVERIQRFNSEGESESSIPVPGKTVHDLGVAPDSGDFYAAVGNQFSWEQNIRKLDGATGAEIGKLEAAELEGIAATKATTNPMAVDPPGNVFATRGNVSLKTVLQFNSSDKQTSEFGTEPELDIEITAIGTNAIGGVYVAYRKTGIGASENFIRAFGPGPAIFEAPPLVAPEIVGQFATSVDRTDAVLAAEINPHFWTDTRYYVQYGTGKCSEGGCEEEKPVSPGAILTQKVFGQPLRSAGVVLEGLEPNTTYHYRFVAESSGGGPVLGEERTFATYPLPAPAKTDCPNQSFRTGFSTPLPNCRAYEMVSPVDKNNGDIKTLLDLSSLSTAFYQSALDGSRFTYSSYRGFADSDAAPYTNQYLAAREGGVGWSSESLDLPQVSEFSVDAFENHAKAFSADLCKSWLMVLADPAPAPGASGRNIYRRDNCGGEGYEALVQVDPPNQQGIYPILQGTSASGEEAIFAVEDKLTEDAASEVWQTYYASEGELRLLCILPSGAPSGGNCSGGMGDGGTGFAGLAQLERLSSLTHAISTGGSRVYWTDSAGNEVGPGKIYLRLNPGEEQSEVSGGECTEFEKACTVKVSETVTSQPSRFLGASADGSKALFEVTAGALAGNLYLFDSGTASSTPIAGDTEGVAGRSEDLSHVYFVSEEALPETSGATAGKPNLYLDREGTKTFVATLSGADVGTEGDAATNTDYRPIYHAARANPDGSHLVFISTESLTGYDNTDQVTGKADSEVYLYEAGSAGLVCVSCNPSGARPIGREGQPMGRERTQTQSAPTAASLPLPENMLYSPRVLSADGRRVFFNSFDALLLRDTNGKADVYEWEAASGPEDCEEQGADLYVASSGGCLSLISSGQSPEDSELLDIGANGNDVFFKTNASLLPQDPGLVDVYDARANGGLPGPPVPPGRCQGEACQFAPPPPNDPTPASASFRGVGNLSPKPPGRCAKGKTRRKGRCVAKRKGSKRHNSKRNANRNRRASR